MIELIRGKLVELFNSLIDPLWCWILSKSWFTRCVVFILILGVAAGWVHLESLLDWGRWAVSVARVAFSATARPPFTSARTTDLEATTSRLISRLEVDLVRLSDQVMEPWATAQTVAALTGTSKADRTKLLEALHRTEHVDCSCWKERNDGDFPPHIPASAWALTALSDLGETANNSQLNFILNAQGETGWWSVFPTNDQRFASTFATAWGMIALDKQVRLPHFVSARKPSIESAIKKGRAWLLSARESGRARWKDYPYSASGKESLSISGLAMHALHATHENDLSDLDKQWLKEIPTALPDAGFCEHAFIWVTTASGSPSRLDSYCQLVVPWLLIGTADVYSSSSVWDRGTLLRWLDRAIPDSRISDADTEVEDWKRAEITVSLRYVLGKP